ncbi:P2 family phage major capsid protein [Pantoea sp. AS-PWVM4]|uniref:P2 family phage major capsid protein n=1 Tax=Pantoea sp. AS-PWVM4 TaxID=1332069 RepID=UPI0008FEE4AC
MNSSVAVRFAFVPPSMPGRRVAITTIDNLHIYTHKGTRFFKAGFNEDKKLYEHIYLHQADCALEDGFKDAAMDENALTLKDT